jgi:hypothetical protein
MHVPEPLARRLTLVRRHLKRVHAPVLDAASVDAAVDACRCVIPDDVLAYLAALGVTEEGGPLSCVFEAEREIDTFCGAMDPPLRTWRKDAGYSHVPFDAWGDWPRFYALFARKPSAKPIAVLNLKHITLEHFASVADYMDWRWSGAVDLSASIEDAVEPQIRRAVSPPQRRVVHEKFGVGVVLRDAEGKLQIDFGDAGVKTLAARFVKDELAD